MTSKKTEPAPNYPIEEGHYVEGDKYSAVAVAIHTLDNKWDEKTERIVRAAIDSGVAIAGSIQTPNLGVEKIIVNLVANPNIRYLVLCGAPAEEGMGGSAALRAVFENGVDERHAIINAGVDGAYVFNISLDAVERLREQVTLIFLPGETDANIICQIVEGCRQETPAQFREYTLYDPGALDKAPFDAKIEIKVEDPFDVEEWELDDILDKL